VNSEAGGYTVESCTTTSTASAATSCEGPLVSAISASTAVLVGQFFYTTRC